MVLASYRCSNNPRPNDRQKQNVSRKRFHYEKHDRPRPQQRDWFDDDRARLERADGQTDGRAWRQLVRPWYIANLRGREREVMKTVFLVLGLVK